MENDLVIPYQSLPVKLLKIDKKELIEKKIDIISEYNLIVSVNEKLFICLTSCGLHLKEFVVGYLIGEGFIKKPDEILSIEINAKDDCAKNLQINCTVCLDTIRLKKMLLSNPTFYKSLSENVMHENLAKIQHTPTFSVSSLYNAFEQFLCHSDLHALTHGVHSAALFNEEMKPIFFCDEIGRHNAIDQIIGMAYLQKISFEDKLLFFTGRLPSKIIKKIVQQKIPIIVSRGMPTSLGILLAQEYNLTLISRLIKNSATFFTGYNQHRINW